MSVTLKTHFPGSTVFYVAHFLPSQQSKQDNGINVFFLCKPRITRRLYMYVNVYIFLKQRCWLPTNLLCFITAVQLFISVNESEDWNWIPNLWHLLKNWQHVAGRRRPFLSLNHVYMSAHTDNNRRKICLTVYSSNDITMIAFWRHYLYFPL